MTAAPDGAGADAAGPHGARERAVSVEPHGADDGAAIGPQTSHEDTALVGPRYAHIRSFALRRGHVTNAQRNAYEQVFPRFAVALATEPLDLAAVFGRNAPTVLEIGFGMGETTAAIALARPDVNFLCVEVFVAGIGALCKRIDEHGIANVRIVQADAVAVVQRMIAPDALAGVHLYFPDPWPKARHHKRRLVAQPFIGRLASRIAPDGYLHCATDWQHYAEQMLEVLDTEPQLANLHVGYAPSPCNPLARRPTTKFHQRGLKLGHGVWDLVFARRQPTSDPNFRRPPAPD